jgi:hypothetical protein
LGPNPANPPWSIGSFAAPQVTAYPSVVLGELPFTPPFHLGVLFPAPIVL